MKTSLYLILLSFSLFFIFSCKEKPVDPKPDPEVIGEKATKKFTGEDLTFNFNNGSSISVEASKNIGAKHEEITIQLIKNESYFNSVRDIVFDFSKTKTGYQYKFEQKLSPGLVKSDISVVLYSPETSKETLDAKIINFNYNQGTGELSGLFSYDGNGSAGRSTAVQTKNYSRLLISWGEREKLNEEDEQVILKLPYYEQPGGTCWATSAAMLIRAYSPNKDQYTSNTIIDYVKALGHSSLDEGLGLWDFKMNLPTVINRYSKTNTEVSTFVSQTNLLQEIIKLLKENKPVILSLRYPNLGSHAVTVIGYKRELVSIAKVNVKLLIHDPQNLGSGKSMNSWVDWEWLMSAKWSQDAYPILYPKTPLSANPAISIGLPINKQLGKLQFKVKSPSRPNSTGVSANLIYDISEPKAYYWEYMGKKVEVLPDTTASLDFSLPIYNTSSSSQKVKLMLSIIDLKAKKTVEEKTVTQNITSGTSYVNGEIPLSNLKSTEVFEGEIVIQVVDASSEKYLDGFRIKFKMEPSTSIAIKLLSFALNGKWSHDDSPAAFAIKNTTLKGSGTKYQGPIYIEDVTTILGSQIKTITSGTLSIEFDKAINPTKIVKADYSGKINIYYDGLLGAVNTQSFKWANVPYDYKTKMAQVTGSKTCNYITEFNSKTDDVIANYSFYLKSYSCDDKSALYLTLN